MSSIDTSLTQAWNSEAAETEVEYDLDLEVVKSRCDQTQANKKTTKMMSYEPEDAYASSGSDS